MTIRTATVHQFVSWSCRSLGDYRWKNYISPVDSISFLADTDDASRFVKAREKLKESISSFVLFMIQNCFLLEYTK